MDRTRFQSIQLLRAVAVLMVVVLHSKIGFSPDDRITLVSIPGISDHGWVGVTLFFVISGFIIANTIDRPNFHLREFLWKRAVRIYPLYWMAMAAGLLAFYIRGWFTADVAELGLAGMLKSFMIFPQAQYPFWNPGWSLEHEVIFYLIAGIVGPIVGLRFLASIMISLGLLGYFVTFWDFHVFDSSQLCFGAGIVAYCLRDRNWKLAIGLAVIFLCIAYLQLYGAVENPPFDTTVWFAIGFACLIVGLLGAERNGFKPPAFMVRLGDASYSLYLFHWLLVMFGDTLVSRFVGTAEFWRWTIIAASIALSIASFRFIEKPLNQWAVNVLRKRQANYDIA